MNSIKQISVSSSLLEVYVYVYERESKRGGRRREKRGDRERGGKGGLFLGLLHSTLRPDLRAKKEQESLKARYYYRHS